MDQQTTPANNNEEISIFDDIKPLPEFYSDRAIYAFSFLFSTIFGAVLLAINIKNSESKKGIPQVLLFGFLYTFLEVWVLNMVHNASTGLSFAANIGGALILQKVLWKKYIGKDVPHVKKSVLVPALIGIAIVALFLWAILAKV
jgi:drug/metabolite transporter superfamily protein YnfA